MEHVEEMSVEEIASLLRFAGAYLRRDEKAKREHSTSYRKAKAARERRTITVHGEAVV